MSVRFHSGTQGPGVRSAAPGSEYLPRCLGEGDYVPAFRNQVEQLLRAEFSSALIV